MGYGGWGRWAPYVPVAERKQQAAEKIKKLRKKGNIVEPVIIEGRNIAETYWGKSWCKNLESYSDLDNRLPRGRSYVRNGFVLDLKITAGTIKALVSGSRVYEININIAPLNKDKWKAIVKECSGKIDSLIELLTGKFSKSVMEIMARREEGLFPQPKEIKFHCSCPDDAYICKHIAAVFYGVGARLDKNPELLFTLRKVDHNELIATDDAVAKLVKRDDKRIKKTFADDELSSMFGVDLDLGVDKGKTKVKKDLQSDKMKAKTKMKVKTKVKTTRKK